MHNGIAEWLWNKGKRSECGNYRGISLLSVPGKVFASIILNRCKNALDQVLREEQCGFRKSRSCTDQLFALRQILEKCMTFQLDVSFRFIDFRAALDSFGGPQDDVQDNETLQAPKKSCCVLCQGRGREGPDVRRKTGIRQGDVWSPIFFGLVINYVLANSVQGGIDIGRCVADLDFADEVALLGVSDSEVQANLHRIESLAEAIGLMINVGKTKNMGVE